MKDTGASLKLMLAKNGFKEISEQDFSQKLKIYFGVNTDERDTMILANQKEYDIDIKNQFINTYPFEPYYIEEFIINEGSENEYNHKFITYNKIIFNDDLSSITSILQSKEGRDDIYFYFDYEKNIGLNQLALRNINYNNFEPDYIQHLFLYNNSKNSNTIKLQHINYISKNNQNSEDYFLLVINCIFSYWDNIFHNELEKYKLICILIDELLVKNEKTQNLERNSALIKYIYSLYEDLTSKLVSNNYFEQKLLAKYSIEYFETIE